VGRPDGVVVRPAAGGPPGGPLSPVRSPRVLAALDGELARRGHRVVRAADDSHLYVRSARAGPRVMARRPPGLAPRLRRQGHAAKRAVAPPEERHFVGFRRRREPREGHGAVRLSTRATARLEEKLRLLVPRQWGGSLTAGLHQWNGYFLGWLGSLGCGTAGGETTLQGLDAPRRRRWRAVPLAHWQRTRPLAKQRMQLGSRPQRAWRRVYEGRQSWWAMRPRPAVDRALRHGSWTARGLVSWAERWRTLHQHIAAPVQRPLALGAVEVVNRPAVGGIPYGPEEP
jgi:RNA-directed DNA polymerase